MTRIAILAGLLLVSCGGAPEEEIVYVEAPATGGGAGAVVEPSTGGTAGGNIAVTGGDLTGGAATGGTAPVCEPGRQVTCPCVGLGDVGVQACREDGSGWTMCDCQDPPGTGGSGNGGSSGAGGAQEPCVEGAHYASDGRLVWLPTDPTCDCVQAVEVILICSHGEIVHKVCDEPQCL